MASSDGRGEDDGGLREKKRVCGSGSGGGARQCGTSTQRVDGPTKP